MCSMPIDRRIMSSETPALAIRRPGRRYCSRKPDAASTVVMARTTQPPGLCASSAQIRTAAQIRGSPGSSGTTMPISPTSMTSPTTTLKPSTARSADRGVPACLAGAGQHLAFPYLACYHLACVHVRADRSRCQTVSLILDVRGEALQLGQVLATVVGAEQQLAT